MPQINRTLLGDAGFELTEEDYVCAVAGLGCDSSYSARQRWTWLPWLFLEPNLEISKSGGWNREQLLNYANEWKDRFSKSDDKNICVEWWYWTSWPIMQDIVGILNHSAIGAESVFIEWGSTHAVDIRWQLPLRISTLPHEPESTDLDKLKELWPSDSLVDVQSLTRDNSRCEVLVVSGDVRDTVRRILDSPFRIRSGYILLIGPVDVAFDILPHVHVLLAETQACGLSVISIPAETVADSINKFVTELSHNTRFEIALSRSFPRDRSLNIAILPELKRTDLQLVAAGLGKRLLDLPQEVNYEIPPDALQQPDGIVPQQISSKTLGKNLLQGSAFLSFAHETAGANFIREIDTLEHNARIESAGKDTSRFLQGDLAGFVEGKWRPEVRGLIVGRQCRLDVFIAPEGIGAIQADKEFPEESLDRVARSLTLQVLFTEPGQWEEPMQGTLELPQGFNRSSTRCRFNFSPTRAGAFVGRVVIYYRGRILQTALLSTTVAESVTDLEKATTSDSLRLTTEVVVQQNLVMLDESPRFDACLVLNHGSSGTSTMTAAGAQGAYVAPLTGLEKELENIHSLLSAVALDSKAHVGGLDCAANADLLCKLAKHGNALYRGIVLNYLNVSPAAKSLQAAEYMQIVSAIPDAVLPLEFVYDYKLPKPDAPVCPFAAQALQQGFCNPTCRPDQSPASHVCPMGFWGLSRVIERHVHDPSLTIGSNVTSDSPSPNCIRKILSLNGASLFAASTQVPQNVQQVLKNQLTAWWPGTDQVITWDDWPEFIKNRKPVLLLVLPHAGGVSPDITLEISGCVLDSQYIDETYVQGDSTSTPIVVLLGCDTSNVADRNAYVKHVAIFRQAKAGLVLGTVATVFGEDAARLAGKLAESLNNVASHPGQRFGEVLRQVKREAVANSEMVAMSVVAFGDAQWKLER